MVLTRAIWSHMSISVMNSSGASRSKGYVIARGKVAS